MSPALKNAIEKLLAYGKQVVNNADNVGCSDDLTVTSHDAVNGLDKSLFAVKTLMEAETSPASANSGAQISVEFSAIPNGKLLQVKNVKTQRLDTFKLTVSEQGSSYHVLLQKQEDNRLRGVWSAREQIDAIGEASEGDLNG